MTSTLPDLALPYGLRDVKLTPIAADGTLGAPSTSVDLPASRTFNFTEAEDFEQLEGDDVIQAVKGKGAQINWSLEAGGVSLKARKVLAGGTIVESGSTPNQVRKFKKASTDSRPYFQVEGQAISDSGGDVHAVVYRCKLQGDLGGEFGNGAFFITAASGIGIARTDGTNDLYEISQNETPVAIATSLGTVPVITTTTLPTITHAVPFATTLAATGSTPMAFTVSAGTLPSGLVLDQETGGIYGNAVSAGAYSFTITATNSAGSDPQAFTGTVA